MRAVAAFFSASALAGCAVLGGRDCASTDWRALGFADGASGSDAPSSALATRGCSAAAASDVSLYLAGWRDGVDNFCAPANGFTLGASGAEFNGVCNGASASEFSAAFRLGESLFAAEADAAAARNALSDAQRDLWDDKHRLAALDLALRAPSSTVPERRLKALEAKELRTAIAAGEARVAGLETASIEAESLVQSLRVRIARSRLTWREAATRTTAAN